MSNDARLRKLLLDLEARPKDPATLHSLAGAYVERGELALARRYLEEALTVDGDNADYWNDLGGVHLLARDYDRAGRCFGEALARRPGFVQAQTNLGHSHFLAGRLTDAIACFRAALTVRPDYADAQYNLAVALERNGQIDLAIDAYEKAIALAPGLAPAHYNLGHLLLKKGRAEAAVDAFRTTLKLAPGHLDARLGLGRALAAAWRTEEAITCLRQYTRERPQAVSGHIQLAQALLVAGDLDGAEQACRKAIALDRSAASAWHALASAIRFSDRNEKDVTAMEALLAAGPADEHSTILLHFALGKAYDDLGAYERAFGHYRRGNALKARSHPITVDQVKVVDELIQAFPAELFQELGALGSPSELPVFVLGMPRSGTTLAEQIIACHPSAHGAGELAYFASLAPNLQALMQAKEPFPHCVRQLDPGLAARLAGSYLELLRRHSGKALRITDKLPGNYRYLGLIRLLFPRATVIHCVRDPLDTCLSMYFQLFDRGHEYSYDFAALGLWYRQYERLMAHWERVLEKPMHRLVYERLTVDPAAESRALIEACGLPWDDACLRIQGRRRQVRTASVAQVRQPIYTHAVHRWRNYEPWLGDLKAALGLTAPDPASADAVGRDPS